MVIRCNYCNKYFRQKKNLIDHNFRNLCNKIPKNNDITKNICNKIPKNVKYNENINNFICNLCNNPFKSKQSLEKHQRKKNKCNIVSNFKCIHCNKYFKQKKNFMFNFRMKLPNELGMDFME